MRSYTDAETGFQYLRARYYEPATGQFLTRDPAVAHTREPYGYTGNNPINRTDPHGWSSNLTRSVAGRHDYFNFHINHGRWI